MKRLHRACLILAMAAGLPVVAAGAVSAAPAGPVMWNASVAQAASCPPEGTRFTVPGHGNPAPVYLIGPKGWQYQIANSTQYFRLWGTWDGILSGFEGCLTNPSLMSDAKLVRVSSGPSVYIWDSSFNDPCYRQIIDWNTFTNKYHFDPAKIQVVAALDGLVCDLDPWT
jgi:hypothetical protein